MASDLLIPYKPSEWMLTFRQIPKYTLDLAVKPTPLRRWHPKLSDNVEIYIKRDDLTEFLISGSKIRKLELTFALALERGCKHVIHHGFLGSNCCRAVSVIARNVGLTPHILVGKFEEKKKNASTTVMELMQPVVKNVESNVEYGTENVAYQTILDYKNELEYKTQEKAIVVKLSEDEPSSVAGIFGYMDLFREIVEQNSHITDIILASWSGETTIGMAIAKYYTKSDVQIHSVMTSSEEFIFKRMESILNNLGIQDKFDEMKTMFKLYDGYQKTHEDDETLINENAMKTGTLLDANYTVKTYRALRHLTEQGVFEGRKVVFLHTGGIFGNF